MPAKSQGAGLAIMDGTPQGPLAAANPQPDELWGDAGGFAGALSRTATAPMDRLRMLQQVHRGKEVLSLRQVPPAAPPGPPP